MVGLNYKYIIKNGFIFCLYVNLLIFFKNLYTVGLDNAAAYYSSNITTIMLQIIVGFIFGVLIGIRNIYKKRNVINR